MNKYRVNILFLILMILSFGGLVSAQGFKGIIPFESTCEDVKRILNVEECTSPQSVYLLKDYWVVVNYVIATPSKKDKWCYRLPVGTVTSFSFSFNKRIPVKDFEYELRYSEKLENDIETIVYENYAKGVSAYVQNGVITNAFFGPTPDQQKKYAYERQSDCKHEKQSRPEVREWVRSTSLRYFRDMVFRPGLLRWQVCGQFI